MFVEDLRDEFAKDFLFPMLQSGAVYEALYLLGKRSIKPCLKPPIQFLGYRCPRCEEHSADGSMNPLDAKHVAGKHPEL